MEAMERLAQHLAGRSTELRKLKEQGVKIIGYPPGGYMPEELVYAAGAVPICLLRGGDPEPLTESLAYLPRFIDTFCRAQIGYRVLGEEPLYQMPDLIVAPITDCNNKAIAECWNFYTDTEVFRYGVPANKDEQGIASDFYLRALHLLKEKLEDFTGNKITDEKLKEEIETGNKIRSLLRSISLMRRSGRAPISSQDFVKLHHVSFYAEKTEFLNILESIHSELKSMAPQPANGPRILFTGSTLAMGDNKIYELLEGTGAEIVFEEFGEGLRPYMHDVHLNGGDLLKALAKTYFDDRIPPGWARPWDESMDHLVDLARDFKVDGVLWYQLMYRDGYDMQSHVFEKKLQADTGLPMLKLESDYDTSEKGPFKTRIETFVQMIQGG